MSEKEKDLVKTDKKELTENEEKTFQGKYFKPETDIYETDNELQVVMDMPGVSKDNVTITVDKGVLDVEGVIDFKRYSKLKAIYSEYDIGNYSRRFKISNEINKDKISAKMDSGVMTLTLPKAEQEKPRQIAIQ